MRARVVGLGALALLLGAPLQAQQRAAAGDRVRVRVAARVLDPLAMPGSSIVSTTGQIINTSDDSLWMRSASRVYVLARHDVITIDVARRGHRSAMRGAIIGGITTGVVLGWYGCEFLHNCDDLNTPSRESRLIGGILPGAAAGALIARAWRTSERWVEGRADR
jgi:hypothetical protein